MLLNCPWNRLSQFELPQRVLRPSLNGTFSIVFLGDVNVIFLGCKITADGAYSHEIKRCLFLGRKAMNDLDSIFKSRDITLPTNVYLVKDMVFPVVMYGCES